ncbi:hypothetical protein ScPMuIL_005692 [Solemya velum]
METRFKDILAAHQRISRFIHKTPIFTSHTCNAQTGRSVFFKSENLQRTGSFKLRGALNAVLTLKEKDESLKGVITHSTGNHGQAVAFAASLSDLPCIVVVPDDTPTVKMDAIRSYGADLVQCEPTPTSRKSTCDRLAVERGLSFIPPYDDYTVIAGQGTIALEFLEAVPDLDAILVPTSGGGMVAGIAIAAKAIKPGIKIFAVEPHGKMLGGCLQAGGRLWPNPPQFLDTIADAIRTQQIGHLTWPIIMQHVEKEVFTATSEDIIVGMRFAFERMKLVVEAASGTVIWAAMSDKMRCMDPGMKNIGVVLSGGNVDIDKLPWLP